MKVSVIIPTHNSAIYLKDAMNSVLGQTVEDIELIVIDDGSTDNTSEIIEQINDRRLHYYREEKAGNYFARNRGMDIAKGEYIAFLDADDIWLPQKLEKQLAVMEANDRVGLSFTNLAFFFNSLGKELYLDRFYELSPALNQRDCLLSKMFESNQIATSTVVLRRSSVVRVGFFDTTHQNAMDYELWLRVLLEDEGAYIPEYLTLRREHETNISRNLVGTKRAVLYILEKIAELPAFQALNQKIRNAADLHRSQALYELGLAHLELNQFDEASYFLKDRQCGGKLSSRLIGIGATMLRSKVINALISRHRRQNKLQRFVFAPIDPKNLDLALDFETVSAAGIGS